MPQDFALNTLLARISPADEDDVFNTKTLLNRIGYYDAPSYGITPYPDGRLFQSIARFQKDHDLTVDGWMKPGGETERALQLVGRRLALDPANKGRPAAEVILEALRNGQLQITKFKTIQPEIDPEPTPPILSVP
jgi:hypothetical protein